MNKKEQWLIWSPDNAWNQKYQQLDIKLYQNDLIILARDLSGKTKDIIIRFEDFSSIYRVRDINYCIDELEEIEEAYGKDFYKNRTFFMLANSGYIEWLHADSFGILGFSSEHYVFVFTDCIVDVVYANEPVITFVD